MAKIGLGADTSLQDLQRFADSAGSAKIKAKTNAITGETVLYTSSSLKSRAHNYFKGGNDVKQAAARTAILGYLDGIKSQPALRGKGIDLAVINVKQFLPAGAIRGEALKQAAADMSAARDEALPTAHLAAEALKSKDPTRIKQAAEKLGNDFAKQMLKKSPAEQQEFVITQQNQPGGIKSQMLRKLDRGLAGASNTFHTTIDTAPPEVRKFIEAAYDHAAANLSNRFLTGADGKPSLAQVTIDGKTYQREDADLGGTEGGFASVATYKEVGGEERILLKFPRKTEGSESKGEMFEVFANEVRNHAEATEGADPNVVGFKGALRGLQGEPVIAMELAPHGDMFQMQHVLAAAVQNPAVLPPDVANVVKLTLMQDMVAGMAHAQEKGIIHLDVKPPNYFVGKDGVVKLGDFGTAAKGIKSAVTGFVRKLTGSPIDNPTWLAPEVLKGSRELAAKTGAISAMGKAAAKFAEAKLKLVGGTKADQEKLGNHIRHKHYDASADYANKHAFDVTDAADSWSVGISLYQILTGETLPDTLGGRQAFMTDQQDAILAFGANHANRAIVAKPGEELSEIENLINDLLHPDPTQRPRLKDVVNHPAFRIPGVGSTEAREFITSLGDPAVRPMDSKMNPRTPDYTGVSATLDKHQDWADNVAMQAAERQIQQASRSIRQVAQDRKAMDQAQEQMRGVQDLFDGLDIDDDV